MRFVRPILDPFLLALVATVLFASLFPPAGIWGPLVDRLGDAAIMLLFFLQGAKLSREQILAGAGNWRLQLAVPMVTFLIFPGLGLGIASLGLLAGSIAGGMLFLTLLPSTVQSSVAFTSIARGNVAAAICAASFSNLLGMAATPALAALLLHRSGAGFSFAAVETILFQLLLPFLVGQALRPLVVAPLSRHKRLIGLVDRGSILLIVYGAFGAAVLGGIWHLVSVETLLIILALSAALLAIVLTITWIFGRLLGLPREDRIVLLFCGSKKSLVTGVPMAAILFPPADVGLVILPLMLFHQLQLIACAVIARIYAAQPEAALTVDES